MAIIGLDYFRSESKNRTVQMRAAWVQKGREQLAAILTGPDGTGRAVKTARPVYVRSFERCRFS